MSPFSMPAQCRWMRHVVRGLLLFAPSVLSAQSGALSLTEAIEAAEARSPELQARAAAQESAQLLIGPAGELPDPELILSIDNLPISGADAGSLNADFMTMRKIGWMQAFPRRSKRNARTAMAGADAELRAAEYRIEQLSVRESVARAWIAGSIAGQRLQQIDALGPWLDAQIAAADAALAGGLGSAAEGLNARLQRSALADRRSSALRDQRLARAELERWLPDLGDRALAAAPDYQSPRDAGLILESVDLHRGLLTLDAEQDQVDAALALAEAEKSLDWAVEFAYADRGPAYSDMLSVGVRIGLPIHASRRQDPLIASRAADRRRFKAERSSMLRAHTATVRALVANWESAVERVALYESSLLPLARDRADAALSAYRGGRGSLAESLIATNDLIEQELALLDRRLELGLAWAELQFSFAEEA